jgi:plastocyanin
MDSRLRKSSAVILVAVIALLGGSLVLAQEKEMAKKEKGMAMKDGATVVELSQVPGEFEPKQLTLKPGKYIFKIKNESVDHEVGLALVTVKPDGSDGDFVPGSQLKKYPNQGETGTSGVVELKPGKYAYFCPLNPTPHYTLTVR